jgi:hypothetical protein
MWDGLNAVVLVKLHHCCHSDQVLKPARKGIEFQTLKSPTTFLRELLQSHLRVAFFYAKLTCSPYCTSEKSYKFESTFSGVTSFRQRVWPKGQLRSKQGAQSSAGR